MTLIEAFVFIFPLIPKRISDQNFSTVLLHAGKTSRRFVDSRIVGTCLGKHPAGYLDPNFLDRNYKHYFQKTFSSEFMVKLLRIVDNMRVWVVVSIVRCVADDIVAAVWTGTPDRVGRWIT